ncbi:hypothetical protein Q6283_28060, partial [Klebsiella pneumoniae]|uniref:hypothetical protein n=1 Tax=Klebsiella pneumoniae TaxID=573 RepID=UPI002731B382
MDLANPQNSDATINTSSRGSRAHAVSWASLRSVEVTVDNRLVLYEGVAGGRVEPTARVVTGVLPLQFKLDQNRKTLKLALGDPSD